MEYKDQAIVLKATKYGDNSAILSLLTKNHGIISTFLKGAFGKKLGFASEVASIIDIDWKGKEDSLGYIRPSLVFFTSAYILDAPLRLLACVSIADLVKTLFKENDNIENVFYLTQVLLQNIVVSANFYTDYINWELDLLKEIGYGLDLECCTVTGQKSDLVYISPKSFKAVSRQAGQDWQHKLLKLPDFFIKPRAINAQEFKDALYITGYFLNKACKSQGVDLPSSRDTFYNKIKTE